MSLDVYLITDIPQIKKASSGIFIRENGETKEITIEEWNKLHPNTEPIVFKEDVELETPIVFHGNITHNLNHMANQAGIYNELWQPDEININTAKELIEPLREGLHKLKSNPNKYKQFNPANGWGSYEGLVKFIDNYLNACYQYPNATIQVSR